MNENERGKSKKNSKIIPLLLKMTARKKLTREDILRLINTIKKHS